MTKNKFKEPKISINKVYTKSGDKGNTSIVGGKKIRKTSSRLQVFGEIDELNVCIGSCIVCINDIPEEYSCENLEKISSNLSALQHELFNLGNMVATKLEDYNDTMPMVNEESIIFLENNMDIYNEKLDSLNSFVLPGGHELNIRLHFARTVCRKCERLAVNLYDEKKIDLIIISYLNRLSDFLFVLSRWTNHLLDIREVTWNPNYKK